MLLISDAVSKIGFGNHYNEYNDESFAENSPAEAASLKIAMK